MKKDARNDELGVIVKIRSAQSFKQTKKRKKGRKPIAEIYKKINGNLPPLWQLVAEKINFMQN